MALSKSKKKMLGVLSIWPFVWMFVLMAIMCPIFIFKPSVYHSFLDTRLVYIPLLIIHVLTCFCVLGVMIYFIIHAVKNLKLTQGMKIVWIILLVIWHIIVNPIYWYVNIWKEQTTVH